MNGKIGPHNTVSQAPSGHGVGFGESVEQNGALFEPGYAHDREVLALINKAAVDFVRQNKNVAVADGLRHFRNVCLGEHTAGRVVRRVQDDQLRAVGNQRCQFFDIYEKCTFFAQRNRNRLAERILDHRLVDGEAGIRVDDFISRINQCQDREENNRLAAWHYNNFFAGNQHAAGAADVVGNRLAQIRETGGGTVVGPAFVESVDTSLDDIGGGGEAGGVGFGGGG